MAPSPTTWHKRPYKWRHKKAAEAIERLNRCGDPSYREIEQLMGLPPALTFEGLSERYHYHLREAGISRKEHNLLYPIRKGDAPSEEPWLGYDLYLDRLRSAHNVGSIIRTVEAFRLGRLLLSPTTPGPGLKKVDDAAMGASVPYAEGIDIASLTKRPLIALETAPDAPSLQEADIPNSSTFLIGNEEYGLSSEALRSADAIVHIPLRGSKNSLNVANAVAILAYELAVNRPKRDVMEERRPLPPA